MKKVLFLFFLICLGYTAESIDLFKEKVDIPKELRTSILDIEKISRIIHKKEQKANINMKIKNENNKEQKVLTKIINSKNDSGNGFVIVKETEKKEKKSLVISHIPYQYLKYKVYKTFGNIVKYKDSDGNIRITRKDKLEKFYKEVNSLIEEYINILIKYKKSNSMLKKNPYLEISVSCSDLYPYYKDKISDCFKLFNLLGKKDKEKLEKFSINFLKN